MNYRHIYHAGNICDVVKHAVLAMLLDQLRGKDAGFCVLDTHAGTGIYDLKDERALKTGEAQAGIFKFIAAATPQAELSAYIDALRSLNPDWRPGNSDKFRFYLGSPLLTCQMLRSQDRLIACELQKEDAIELRRNLSQYPQAQSHHRDGYEALRAFLPPVEKRGLVLIDPPYEDAHEFERLGHALIEAYRHWPQGVFVIWYPVKERPAIWRFCEALIASNIPKILCAEFVYEEEVRADRLNGCGLIIINPPWQADEKLRRLFPALHILMQSQHQGSQIKWLARD